MSSRSLVIFNPTEQLRSSVVSVVIDSPDARVVDAETGRPMAAQISAVWAEPRQTSTEAFQVTRCRPITAGLWWGHRAKSRFLNFLCFFFQLDFVAELPPLSLVVYHVTKSSVGSAPRAQYTVSHHGDTATVKSDHFQVSELSDSSLTLSNKQIQIWSSAESGLLQVRLSK